jgi:hemerythrin superfamily protein
MTIQLEDAKRLAIGTKLADMKALQELIISNEEQLISACTDSEVRSRFQEMLEDDRKNLGVLETTIIQYGNPAQPKDKTQQLVEKTQQMMQGSELNLYEKVAQHELLKHAQVMSGLVVHKAAQVVGADIEAAITPLNTVNFENRAHQEQLKGVLEILGTRELTGQDPDQGVWARVQDAVAAITGIMGGGVTRAKEDMNITEILIMDHRKVDTLFMEIENSKDANKRAEFFGQLYKDLTVHSKAEEEAVYPKVRSFFSDTQELYDEQAELRQLLDQIKAGSPNDAQFMEQVKQAKKMVQDHVREEENDMFSALRQNMSESQMQQMTKDFKAAKERFAQELA